MAVAQEVAPQQCGEKGGWRGQHFEEQVNDMENTIKVLEKDINDTTNLIEEKISDIEKNEEESTDNLYYEKLNTIERRIYILEKRRLGSDLC